MLRCMGEYISVSGAGVVQCKSCLIDTGEKEYFEVMVRDVGVKFNHRCWWSCKIDFANVASHARWDMCVRVMVCCISLPPAEGG